jgi:hypothetical protein
MLRCRARYSAAVYIQWSDRTMPVQYSRGPQSTSTPKTTKKSDKFEWTVKHTLASLALLFVIVMGYQMLAAQNEAKRMAELKANIIKQGQMPDEQMARQGIGKIAEKGNPIPVDPRSKGAR